MKQFTVVCSLFLCLIFQNAAPTGEDGETTGAELLTNALQHHVHDGLVDYHAIAEDEDFRDYLKWLETAEPEKLEDRYARMAFWVNAYNALAIKGVLLHSGLNTKSQPQENKAEPDRPKLISSVLDVDGFFNETKYKVAGQKMTLDHLEKEVLFPKFQDERLHFVLVCAAVSCPPLAADAYTGDNIQARLEAVARHFLNNPEKNRLDRQEKILYLSQIFNWYRSDFETEGKSLVDYVKPYLAEEAQQFLDAHAVEVKFLEYDWQLNKY